MKNKAGKKHRPHGEKRTTENQIPQERAGHSRTLAMAAIAVGFLGGFLILYFQPLNDIFEKHFRSEIPTFITWYPATFEFFNRLSGTSLLAFSFASLIYVLYGKQAIDSFLNRHYRSVLIFLIACIGILAFFVCYNKFFHVDEIEHIHCAWYIKKGYIPYRDFFEHHNPLFWFSLLPVLYLGGDSVNTILLARLFMGCVMLGIVYCAYLIASTVAESKETGLFAAVLLFSTTLFIEKAIEIRPDGLQVLFGMISLYCLIRFIPSRDNTYIFYTGLSAALSFLFLQKAIFLVIAYAMIFAYGFFKREISVKNALCFSGGLLLPLLLFWAYLHMTGSVRDYFLTNWQLNWHNLGARAITAKPFKAIADALSSNLLLLVFAAIAVVYILLKQKINKEMKIIVFIGLVQVCSVVIYKTTLKHYYLFPIALCSVPGAYFLANIFAAGKILPTHRAALAAMIILWALPFLLIDSFNSNRFQLERMKYVLNVTKDTEIVYDGANYFNLFRHDMHYFWFQIGQLTKYNNLSGDRFGDYDCCSLIKAKRPKIVNEIRFNFKACGLGALYDKTKYPGVYIRRESDSLAKHHGGLMGTGAALVLSQIPCLSTLAAGRLEAFLGKL